MTIFKNYLVEKPMFGRVNGNKLLLGEKIINAENEFYSSNKINSPIASKNLLNRDEIGRYMYGADFQIYRKDPTLVNKKDYEIVYLDIENTGGVSGDIAKRKLTCITFYFSKEQELLTLIDNMFKTEVDFLIEVIKILKRDAIFTGWNLKYDISFIINRYYYLTGEKINLLSPFIDMLGLYRHYVKDAEVSFKLDYILKKNEIAGKIEYEGSLDELYKDNIEKYIEYNRRDVAALVELDKKLHLFSLCKKIINITKCLWQDIINNTHIIDAYLYNYLDEREMIFRDRDKNVEKGKYVGALVHPPIAGLYNNVRCFDFNSLYPNIMISYNISPETKNKNGCYCAANGIKFIKEKGIVPEILSYLLNERKRLKRAGDNIGQKAMKTLANSFYGVMGSPYFRLYDKDIAEAITLTGQKANLYVCKFLRQICEDENIILAGDTDSIYVNMDKIKMQDDILEDYINEVILQEYCYMHNIPYGHLKMADEYGRVKALFFKIKKNYVLKMGDKLIIKGFDKSDRSKAGMIYFKYIVNKIFEEKNVYIVNDFIDKIKEDISNNPINKLFYRRYKINKKREEYGNKQAWFDGIDLFLYYNEGYKKDIDRGYYIPLIGKQRVSAKTGRKLKGREKHILCVPDSADFEQSLKKVLSLTGYDIDVEKIFEDIYKPFLMPITEIFLGAEE